MGLAERRAAKEFQDKHYPQLKQKIDAAAGQPVMVEVDWDSLQLSDASQLYNVAWPKVYFEPLAEALKKIAADDLGRQALKEKLGKIIVRNSGHKGATFAGGELIIDYEPITNIDYPKERQRDIENALEAGL